MDKLRTKPFLWIGIATAAGLTLGIIGRIVRRRRRKMPAFVLLETC